MSQKVREMKSALIALFLLLTTVAVAGNKPSKSDKKAAAAAYLASRADEAMASCQTFLTNKDLLLYIQTTPTWEVGGKTQINVKMTQPGHHLADFMCVVDCHEGKACKTQWAMGGGSTYLP